MLRTGGLHLPQEGLTPRFLRPGLPERQRATTRVPWYLPRPDSHRLVVVNFQDEYHAHPLPTTIQINGKAVCSHQERTILGH